MRERIYSLFGVFGPLIAYISIGISIVFSPWFSWSGNALSDLGHSIKSDVAPIFNFGLLITGFLTIIYAVKVFRKYAKFTSLSLTISAFLLQLVATFDEVYNFLHFSVSLLFFVFLGTTLLIYIIEKKSALVLAVFIIGLCSWILYYMKMYEVGIAVPEIISSLAVVSLLVSSTIKLLKNPNSLKKS